MQEIKGKRLELSGKLAAIFGIEGTSLKADEKAFFKDANPLGYIIFARNAENPEQLKKLTSELKEISGDDNLPVLIDQEGGRVARLRPPHWRKSPSASELACLGNSDGELPARAIYLNARLIAHELQELGITVNCAPLADIPTESCHEIIGDRAYGDNAEIVIKLAANMARGLTDGGVLPVLKHIPGHGRAEVDSHESLPIVNASLEELENSDFIPFKNLNYIPLGMTAHIRYSSLDNEKCATLSPKIIKMIREDIGFDGLLMSDDVSMKALDGDMADLSRDILKAGCDLVLHCNGRMEEMQKVATGAMQMDAKAVTRMKRAWETLPESGASFKEITEIKEEFDNICKNAIKAA